MIERLTVFSIDRPKTTIALIGFLTLLFGLQFPGITVDADPENMLAADAPSSATRSMSPFGVVESAPKEHSALAWHL